MISVQVNTVNVSTNQVIGTRVKWPTGEQVSELEELFGIKRPDPERTVFLSHPISDTRRADIYVMNDEIPF